MQPLSLASRSFSRSTRWALEQGKHRERGERGERGREQSQSAGGKGRPKVNDWHGPLVTAHQPLHRPRRYARPSTFHLSRVWPARLISKRGAAQRSLASRRYADSARRLSSPARARARAHTTADDRSQHALQPIHDCSQSAHARTARATASATHRIADHLTCASVSLTTRRMPSDTSAVERDLLLLFSSFRVFNARRNGNSKKK